MRGMWLPTQAAGERCGRGVMNASGDRQPGLAGAPWRSGARAGRRRAGRRAAGRARSRRRRGRRRPRSRPTARAPSPSTSTTSRISVPEVDEGLPDGRLGRHADAAHLEPGRLERGERARQVVRERDDVVDGGAPFGWSPGRRARTSAATSASPSGRSAPGPRRRARAARRPAPSAPRRRRARRREAEPRPRVRLPGQRRSGAATGTKMSVPDGSSAIICRHRDARPRIAAARAAAGARARTAASDPPPRRALARVLDRRGRVAACRSRASSSGRRSSPRRGCRRTAVEWLAVFGAVLLYGLATVVRGERWQRLLVDEGGHAVAPRHAGAQRRRLHGQQPAARARRRRDPRRADGPARGRWACAASSARCWPSGCSTSACSS